MDSDFRWRAATLLNQARGGGRLAVGLLVLGGCGEIGESRPTQMSTGIDSSAPATGVGVDGTTENGGSANTDTADTNADTPPDDGDGGIVFDVGDGGFCGSRAAGIHCDGERFAVTCGQEGDEVGRDDCAPRRCEEGVGCLVCEAGQFDCQGDRILECDTSLGGTHAWIEVGVCDPASGQRCNVAMGVCEPASPLGGIEPSGVYYQFVTFDRADSAFLGGYDVDSIGDKIYTVDLYGTAIDEYTLTLLDSDGDGLLEPNQHPLNPDHVGPVEERVLTHVKSIPSPVAMFGSQSEVFAFEDRLMIGGSALSEYMLATGDVTTIATVPAWFARFSHIAYDEVTGEWYASNETARRVVGRNNNTGSWGITFDYPPLAGDHMDGLEMVTDPNTGASYLYVSDMTSNFIGQYRKDPVLGWQQENLFTYEELGGAALPVEGLGFGALNHFWAASSESLYELGGGGLDKFTAPEG